MSLNEASADIKLAVDLIELLETSHIDPALALRALAIVTADYERKLTDSQQVKLSSLP